MQCRVCDSARLDLAIDFGEQPWANQFLPPEQAGQEPYYALRVVQCQDCRTAQLDYTVPKETLFGDHTYLSGTTRTLSRHFAEIAREIDHRFGGAARSRRVLDIGSNDGTQLAHYQQLGYDVLGVESSLTTARIANERGIPTVNTFFNQSLARNLDGKFDVINAAGVFFHLEELHSVTDGIRLALSDDGVFVVQALYMKSIVENLAFDQIYHEHLLYYTVQTLEQLLRRHHLSLFDAYVSPIHGGSLIAFVCHEGRQQPSSRLAELRAAEVRDGINELATYRAFASRIAAKRTEERAYLEAARGRGDRVFGYGAPVKGNTLLNYFGIGTDLIECLVEKNPLRDGLVSPGMHIPVVMEADVTIPPDIYYVLAWNFRAEILANNRALLDAGVTFHFPVTFNETVSPRSASVEAAKTPSQSDSSTSSLHSVVEESAA
jgi:SAM-dependent methyltransferase